jgi:crossover junction endodeoxyribonuclease RuvC
MRILGIDPGYGRTGWGVIEDISGKVKPIDYSCLETPPHTPDAQRLQQMYAGLTMILDAHRPDAVAVEELFFNTNVTTALKVGQARGVVLLAVAQHNLSVVSYTPLQVKMALTGYGRAEKSQIAQMVKTVLSLQQIPKPDDVTDALAIALTHAFSRKMVKK